MQFVTRNVEFVAAPVLDDEIFPQAGLNLESGCSQKSADAMLIVDDIIPFFNIDEIMKRAVSAKGNGALAAFDRKDENNFVLPE